MRDIQPTIEAVIHAWESAFPGKFASWYLLGSYANGSAVEKSDLDLFFLMSKEAESERDQAEAGRVAKLLQEKNPTKIECWGQTLDFLNGLENAVPVSRALVHTVSIKMGSKLLKGIDDREKINLPSLTKYSEALSSIATGWIDAAKPDFSSGDGYLGYCRTDTIALVRRVLSIAAAVAVKKEPKYISSKSMIADFYERSVGGEWMGLVAAAHVKLWQEWGYSLPERKEDQWFLQDFCRKAVAFEKFGEWELRS